MSKSYATLKTEQRARMREQGYVLKQIWVRPDRWSALKKIINDAMGRNL